MEAFWSTLWQSSLGPCLSRLHSRSTQVRLFLDGPKTVIYLFLDLALWEVVCVFSPPLPEVLAPELSAAASMQNSTTFLPSQTLPSATTNSLPALHIQLLQPDCIAREREHGLWDRYMWKAVIRGQYTTGFPSSSDCACLLPPGAILKLFSLVMGLKSIKKSHRQNPVSPKLHQV